MKIDPTALGEFLEQNAIETAGGAVIDVLDGGLMTQPGIAQPGEQALITPIADLAIEQQAEPFRMSCSVVASAAASISPKALAMPLRPS